MSYTPTNRDAVVLSKIRRMVALSATFQAQAGLTYADALNRVAIFEERSEGFPKAVVEVSSRFVPVAGGSASFLRPEVVVSLMLTVQADEELDDIDDQRLKAVDVLGGIVDEVVALAGVDDSENATSHLNITQVGESFYMESAPEQAAVTNEQGNRLGVFFDSMTFFTVGD